MYLQCYITPLHAPKNSCCDPRSMLFRAFFRYKAVRLHGLKDYSPHAIEQCRIACARKSSRAPLALMDNFSYGVIL